MNSIDPTSHYPLHFIMIYINTIFYSIRTYESEMHIFLLQQYAIRASASIRIWYVREYIRIKISRVHCTHRINCSLVNPDTVSRVSPSARDALEICTKRKYETPRYIVLRRLLFYAENGFAPASRRRRPAWVDDGGGEGGVRGGASRNIGWRRVSPR